MRCGICELACEIALETYGRCRMYQLDERGIVPRYVSQISALDVVRLEDIPISHFHPQSRTLAIGTIGCNFDCGYCNNRYVAHASMNRDMLQDMSPSDILDKAEQSGCENIAFTANEPAASFPFFLALARQGKARGLRVGCSTNGYFTTTAMAYLSKVIDFVNVSLKATSDPFYRRDCRVPSVRPVLRNIRLFRDNDIHVEVSTPVTLDTWEDDLLNIAAFIGSISRDIPWHVFELPNHKTVEQEWSDLAFLTNLREKALQNLDHVSIRVSGSADRTNGICSHC